MELANQQERRLADLQWFAGFFDGEGCISIVQYKQRRFTQFAVSARLVNSSETAFNESKRILVENGLAFHIGAAGPSHIGSKRTWRITVSGFERVRRFLNAIGPYLRVKSSEAEMASRFVNSRMARGKHSPYNDEEIDLFIWLRDLHGYRLNESSETLRKTLIERRYSPISARKTESPAEMTGPA